MIPTMNFMVFSGTPASGARSVTPASATSNTADTRVAVAALVDNVALGLADRFVRGPDDLVMVHRHRRRVPLPALVGKVLAARGECAGALQEGGTVVVRHLVDDGA